VYRITAVSSGAQSAGSKRDGWSLRQRVERVLARLAAADRDEQRALRHLREGRASLRAQRQLGAAFEADEGARAAVAQVVGDLARLQQDVDRHQDRAELEHRVVGDDELRQVRAGEHDAVAAADAARREPVRERSAAASRLAQVSDAEPQTIATSLREHRRAAREEAGKVHWRLPGLRRRSMPSALLFRRHQRAHLRAQRAAS
jgi:hypothetical protein